MLRKRKSSAVRFDAGAFESETNDPLITPEPTSDATRTRLRKAPSMTATRLRRTPTDPERDHDPTQKKFDDKLSPT